MIPRAVDVGPADAPHEAWILHGILGSGLNWRAFARRLAAAAPGWRLVLVDLRGHGDSGPGDPPHTVAACAGDLVALAEARGRAPEALVGHSFGGKVALLAAEPLGVARVVVLDAVPGPAGLDGLTGDEDVPRLVDALGRVPQPLARREDVLAPLRDAGFGDAIGAWMTTNLGRGDDGLRWRFDLDVVRALLLDYAEVDAWPEVERLGPGVTLVRAGRSDRWTPSVRARLADVAARRGARAITLAEAGHWVHVDAPDALLAAIVEALGVGGEEWTVRDGS